MSDSSIDRLTNTEDGPVAHLNCYSGHPLVRYFRAGNSRTELAEPNILSTAGSVATAA